MNSILQLRERARKLQIDLEYHQELNQRLWDGVQLRDEVRQKLISFGKTWAAYAKIPPDLIQEIIMTGGNANYNYTPKSDIDVHVIIKRDSLGKDREMVDEYLKDKKTLWSLTNHVTVLGYPLEPYAQDTTEKYPENQGVFSLTNNRWIQFPARGEYDFQNDDHLRRKVRSYMRLIDHIIENDLGLEAMKRLKNRLSEMRGAAIAKGGEFSFENLVFKELRNQGYLDKMKAYSQGIRDSELSLSDK